MLKTLCDLNATSGREHSVRDYIISQLPKDVSYRIDALGNLIVDKKGKNRAKNKVVLDAHMDEVGFIVTFITDDGYLKISPVGGMDERVVFGRGVTIGTKNISGVIGGKAVHHLSAEEKDSVPKCEDMFVDIGAASKKEALECVSLGDSAYFKSEYVEFGDGFIKAKALDDRLGCDIMLKMINSELLYDLTFSFSVQEEIGTRGATTMAYSENPDYAIVIETTTAADIPDVPKEKKVCLLGGGAVVTFMDGGTIYDKDLYDKAFEIAGKNNINCQTKTVIAGGNNASAIHRARGGIKTLAISVPTRYIHSASSVVKKQDVEDTKKLINLMAEEFSKC
ncbi:MAG: M42 family peptidase [Oscillospiraceae bacterium]